MLKRPAAPPFDTRDIDNGAFCACNEYGQSVLRMFGLVTAQDMFQQGSMSLRILVIGLPGDRLSESVVRACLEVGETVAVMASVQTCQTPGTGESPPLFLANRAARPWRGDADELLREIREKNLSTIITAGCHHILHGSVLESVNHCCFNVHPSLLPKYRGFAPIFWQYHAGDRQSGVSVHRMERGVDSGPIVGQEAFEVSMGSTLAQMVPCYSAAAGRLVASLLSQISRGRVEERPQDELAPVLAAPKPRDDDYRIDWHSWPLERIWHFLRMSTATAGRALSEFLPAQEGTTFHWEVLGMETGDDRRAPGELFEDARGWAITHRDGAIRLQAVRPT